MVKFTAICPEELVEELKVPCDDQPLPSPSGMQLSPDLAAQAARFFGVHRAHCYVDPWTAVPLELQPDRGGCVCWVAARDTFAIVEKAKAAVAKWRQRQAEEEEQEKQDAGILWCETCKKEVVCWLNADELWECPCCSEILSAWDGQSLDDNNYADFAPGPYPG